MKRKLLLTALCLTSAATCAFGLAACEDKTPTEHTHAWGDGWTVTAENKPTATAEGKATRTCSNSDCDATVTETEYTLPALNSTEYTVTGDTATCAATGTAAYTYNKGGVEVTFTAATPVNPDNHSWGEWSVKDENKPTAEAEGKATCACERTGCTGEPKEHILPELDSTEYTVTGDTATCVATGTATYSYNKDGVEVTFTAATPVNPDNHSWDNGSVTQEPTCIAKGVKTYTCTADGCGETKTEGVDTVRHSFGTELYHDETGHWYKCTTEGCVAKDFHNHSWSLEGRVTKRPTASAMGETSYKCTECDEYNVVANIPVEPLTVGFNTPLTTPENVINYKFMVENTGFAQLYEFEFEGGLTINWNGSDGLEETASGTITADSASKIITLPAGTRVINVEVSAESGGISLTVTRRYALGEMQNPDEITVGTAKTQALTANAGYYYAFALENEQQLTAVCQLATLAFYTEEGTALTSSENLAAYNFTAGKYLLSVTAKSDTPAASVLLRATADEDYSKVANLPKEVNTNNEITADSTGTRYYVFTSPSAGTLKVTGVAWVRYYSDAQFKNDISNNLSISKNAKVWIMINFAQGETAKVEFEVTTVEVNYSATFTDTAGTPIPNQTFVVRDSTGNDLKTLTSGEEGKIEFTLPEGTYYIVHKEVYNDPYKWSTETILATNPERTYEQYNRFLLHVNVATVDGDNFEDVAVKVFEGDKQVGEAKVSGGVASVYCTVVSGQGATYKAELDYDKNIYLGNGTVTYNAKSTNKEATVTYPALTKGIKYVLTLVDGEKQPLTGKKTVTLKNGTTTVAQVETNENGVASFTDLLAPGEYNIELSDNYLTETKTGNAENVTVVCTLFVPKEEITGAESAGATKDNTDCRLSMGDNTVKNESVIVNGKTYTDRYYTFYATEGAGTYTLTITTTEGDPDLYISTVAYNQNGKAAQYLIISAKGFEGTNTKDAPTVEARKGLTIIEATPDGNDTTKRYVKSFSIVLNAGDFICFAINETGTAKVNVTHTSVEADA